MRVFENVDLGKRIVWKWPGWWVAKTENCSWWVQDTKKHRKTYRKVPSRNPMRKKNAQLLCWVAKTQESIKDERRAPRKHKTGLRKNTRGTHRNM